MSDFNRAEWLDSLKVGDKVAMQSSGYGQQTLPSYMYFEVVKIPPKRGKFTLQRLNVEGAVRDIEVGRDGYSRNSGSSYWSSRIEPITITIKMANARAKKVYALRAVVDGLEVVARRAFAGFTHTELTELEGLAEQVEAIIGKHLKKEES